MSCTKHRLHKKPNKTTIFHQKSLRAEYAGLLYHDDRGEMCLTTRRSSCSKSLNGASRAPFFRVIVICRPASGTCFAIRWYILRRSLFRATAFLYMDPETMTAALPSPAARLWLWGASVRRRKKCGAWSTRVLPSFLKSSVLRRRDLGSMREALSF